MIYKLRLTEGSNYEGLKNLGFKTKDLICVTKVKI